MRNNPGANVKSDEGDKSARHIITRSDVLKYPFQSRQFRGYCIIYSSSRRSCGDDMSGMGSRKGISPNREAWRRIGPSLIPIRTAPQASRATLDMYRTLPHIVTRHLPRAVGKASTMESLTPTGLQRWSCQDRQLPPVDSIKAIHVYDFDNTCRPIGSHARAKRA